MSKQHADVFLGCAGAANPQPHMLDKYSITPALVFLGHSDAIYPRLTSNAQEVTFSFT